MTTEMALLHKRIEELKEHGRFLLQTHDELRAITKKACRERPALLILARAAREWWTQQSKLGGAAPPDSKLEYLIDALAKLDKAQEEGQANTRS